MRIGDFGLRIADCGLGIADGGLEIGDFKVPDSAFQINPEFAMAVTKALSLPGIQPG